MFEQMRLFSVCSLFALAIGMTAVHASDSPLLNLRYGQAYSAAHSIFGLPISVAEREGLFSREGLHVQVIIPIPGGSDKMIDALNDNWVDVTHVATPFLIRAAIAGSDAIAIDTEFKNPIYSVIAKPEIKTFTDLKSKRVGLADEAGTISIATRKLLANHGLRRGDFSVKVEEGTPARWNCLRGGDCDAVVLGQPQDLEAVALGYRLLGRTDEAVPNLLYTVTAVRRSWADAHKNSLVHFVRAMAAAFAFIHNPINRNSVIRIIAQTTNTSDSIAGQTLDLLSGRGRDVLPQHGEIDLDGLQQVIAMMGAAGLLKTPLPQANRFVDLQYFRAAIAH